MSQTEPIPVFTLFGETAAFPDVVHCERFADRATAHDWRISPHRHSQMAQVFHIEKGQATAQVDGRQLVLKDGMFLYLPAQIVHGFAFSKGIEGHVLSFPLPVLASLGPVRGALSHSLAAPAAGPVDMRLAQLIGLFAQTCGAGGSNRAQIAVGLGHAILAAIAEAAETRGPATATRPGPRDRMDAFEALIDAHLAQGWKPRDYATAMHVTTGQLSRICRAAKGVGAAAHIEARLMTEACRLLAFTRIPVADIAFRLGFVDPSYFSRRFRAVEGRTPSAYRARFAA